jgi:hypothetical protein
MLNSYCDHRNFDSVSQHFDTHSFKSSKLSCIGYDLTEILSQTRGQLDRRPNYTTKYKPDIKNSKMPATLDCTPAKNHG